MKLPVSISSFATLDDVATFLRTLATSIATGWNVNHRVDGTHSFPWARPPYAAVDYHASGTMTWTVTEPQVICSRYRQIDTGVEWTLVLDATVVAGAASTTLRVRLPNNLRGGTYTQRGVIAWVDNGVAGHGVWEVAAGDSVVGLYTTALRTGNWAAAGTTSIDASMQFEVAP